MTLKQRIAAGDFLLGTFVKTPSPVIIEVLASCGLDLVCLDAEHAPFDRGMLDACIFAARACNLPVLVRPATAAAEHILNALDCGADGVMLPHIRTVSDAVDAVRVAHYQPGGRGYAGSSRAAGYGLTSMAAHRAASAERTCVIAQIEDIEALEDIHSIGSVPGIDALFVGRIDLTVALDAESADAPEVIAAVEKILAAAVLANRPCGMFVPANSDVAGWRSKGASLFLQSSDHGLIRSGARQLRAECED